MTTIKFPSKQQFKAYTVRTKNDYGKIMFPRWFSMVRLGKYSFMSDDADVQCFRKPYTLHIGKYSSIGNCTFMVDGDHNLNYASTYPFAESYLCSKAPLNKPTAEQKPAVVGNDVWIGDNAYVYGNIVIHDGAVVAGNAVVTKDVPPYAVVAGNPARIVKYRFEETTIQQLLETKWWNMPDEFVHKELAPVIDDIELFLHKIRNARNLNKSQNNTHNP